MTQTSIVVSSYDVTPTTPAGSILRVTDDSILVKVWSTPIACDDTSSFTATPGVGGDITVQFSADGVNYTNAAEAPYTSTFSGGVPPTSLWVRATTTVSTGALAVDTPVPWTELTASQVAAVSSMHVTGLVLEDSSADARTYNSALLLSAIGSLSSTYGGELILPAGSIYVNPDTVYADRPLQLRGRGRPGWKGLVGATLLKTVADGDAITLLAEGSSLRDFGVVCEKPTQPTGGAGIKIGSASAIAHGFDIRNVSTNRFYEGFYVLNGAEWNMDRVLAYGSVKSGIHIRNYSQTDNGDPSINNCWIAADYWNPDYGIWWESGSGVKLSNSKINWHDNGSTRFKHGKSIFVRPADGTSLPVAGAGESNIVSLFLFSNVSMEAFRTHGIHFDGSSNTTQIFTNISISNCQFGAVNSDPARGIHIEGTGAQKVTNVNVGGGNTFYGCKGAVFLQYVDTVYVAPQVMKAMLANGPMFELGTACTSVVVDPNQVVRWDSGASAFSRTLFQDSGTTGTLTYSRKRRSWSQGRELGTVTTADASMYRIVTAAHNGGVIRVILTGKDNAGNAVEAVQERLLSSSSTNVVTLATVGTDVAVNGANFTITWDLASAGELTLKVKAAGAATSLANGFFNIELDGEFYLMNYGFAYNA